MLCADKLCTLPGLETAHLGQPLPVLSYCHGKDHFLMSRQNFPCCNLWPLTLVVLLYAAGKGDSMFPITCQISHNITRTLQILGKATSVYLCFTPLLGTSFFLFLLLPGVHSVTSSARSEWRGKVLKYGLKDKGIIQQNANIQFKGYSQNCNSIILLPATLCVFSVSPSYREM